MAAGVAVQLGVGEDGDHLRRVPRLERLEPEALRLELAGHAAATPERPADLPVVAERVLDAPEQPAVRRLDRVDGGAEGDRATTASGSSTTRNAQRGPAERLRAGSAGARATRRRPRATSRRRRAARRPAGARRCRRRGRSRPRRTPARRRPPPRARVDGDWGDTPATPGDPKPCRSRAARPLPGRGERPSTGMPRTGQRLPRVSARGVRCPGSATQASARSGLRLLDVRRSLPLPRGLTHGARSRRQLVRARLCPCREPPGAWHRQR